MKESLLKGCLCGGKVVARPRLAMFAFCVRYVAHTQTRIRLRLSRPYAGQAVCLLSSQIKNPPLRVGFKFGPEGTRTPDLLRVKQALYQLSYRSVKLYFIISNSRRFTQLFICSAHIISRFFRRNAHTYKPFLLWV